VSTQIVVKDKAPARPAPGRSAAERAVLAHQKTQVGDSASPGMSASPRRPPEKKSAGSLLKKVFGTRRA
jgi:hypothetical protein